MQNENVENNAETTRKLIGGITGKGFQPGQSGNPGGRPKKKPITEMFERIMADAVAATEIEEALKKVFSERSGMAKVLLIEKMAERLEGRVSQPVEAELNITNMTLSERMRLADERLGTAD